MCVCARAIMRIRKSEIEREQERDSDKGWWNIADPFFAFLIILYCTRYTPPFRTFSSLLPPSPPPPPSHPEFSHSHSIISRLDDPYGTTTRGVSSRVMEHHYREAYLHVHVNAHYNYIHICRMSRNYRNYHKVAVVFLIINSQNRNRRTICFLDER